MEQHLTKVRQAKETTTTVSNQICVACRAIVLFESVHCHRVNMKKWIKGRTRIRVQDYLR